MKIRGIYCRVQDEGDLNFIGRIVELQIGFILNVLVNAKHFIIFCLTDIFAL